MRDLMAYVRAQNRRLVYPIGAGALGQAWWEEHRALLSWEECMAQSMAWQCHTLGYALNSMTIPALDMLAGLGLGTDTLWDGSRYIPSGQLTTLEEAEAFFARAPREPEVLRRHLAALRRGTELCSKPIALGTFGPLTLAGYLLGAEELLMGMIQQPELVRRVLSGITEILVDWHRAGVESGGEFLWVAEPMAVLISPRHFRAFALPCLRSVFASEDQAGFLHIPGDTTYLLNDLVVTGAQCLSLDAPVGMTRALATAPEHMVLLGDIDAFLLLEGTRAEVERAVERLHRDIAGAPNVIISSGGGINAQTPYENIAALFADPWGAEEGEKCSP